jgi:hypothetical protein
MRLWLYSETSPFPIPSLLSLFGHPWLHVCAADFPTSGDVDLVSQSGMALRFRLACMDKVPHVATAF